MEGYKVPTSQEEMDALRASLRQEIAMDDLDTVVGGNDDVKGKVPPGMPPFICPFCGASLQPKFFQDVNKHIVHDCPKNPYK